MARELSIGYGTCDYCHATCTEVACTMDTTGASPTDGSRICRECTAQRGGDAVTRWIFDGDLA